MILQLQNISKNFGDFIAVNNVSINIPRGTIYGLLGPNGAGKTTLIRMITGITLPEKGSIIYNGKTSKGINYSIAYMPEERGLYKKMKVGEQLMFLAQIKGLSKIQAKQNIDFWLTRFQIEHWWNKNMEDLSKGMQQKIQFIATVINNPDLLILDEPFSGLDPINAAIIEEEIRLMKNEGKSIIFSTHRLEQVDQICDELVLINKGENILEGNVQEIKQKFKQHIFEMKFAESIDESVLQSIDLVKKESNFIQFKLNESENANDVLRYFIEQNITITGFREILPSVNEIFIQQVKSLENVAKN